MKKAVQILLLCALLPSLAFAREETMEERKKRVTRKYLRERSQITLSDLVVPSDLPEEDEDVADSEKFKDIENTLQAEDGVRMPAPPPPRPMPRPTESNWLLEDSAGAENPYGEPYDPYAAIDPSVDANADFGAARDGNSWDRRSAPVADGSTRRYEGYQNPSGGYTDPRSRGFGAETRTESRYGSSSSRGETDMFGRQRQSDPVESGGVGASGQPRAYGATPAEGLLVSPFSQRGAAGSDRSTPGFEDSRQQRPQGYQPYESPYDQQREQRQQQWSDAFRNRERDTPYQKPNNYKDWKDRNPGWDPTKDDAYLDEMMPDGRKR